MQRTEEVAYKALMRVNNDRYLLANILFARIDELGKGAKPLVDMDVKKYKLADIAMMEVAEGKIELQQIDNI